VTCWVKYYIGQAVAVPVLTIVQEAVVLVESVAAAAAAPIMDFHYAQATQVLIKVWAVAED
jgi:hypothetical protein